MLWHAWKLLLICTVLPTALLAADSSPVQNALLPQTAATPISKLTLHLLSHHAGYILQGIVTRVALTPAKSPDEAATMSITFRVTRSIRGVREGETLKIHEWAGLWRSGSRYKPGERVLLFLYPQSRLGLTSPVGGALGKFSTDASGQIVFSPAQSALLPAGTNIHPALDGKMHLAPEKVFQMLQQPGQVEK